MISRVSMFAMAGAASLTALGSGAYAQPGLPNLPDRAPNPLPGKSLTQTCAFRDGPRAGQTINYSGSPGAVAVHVGSRCADMQGSSGVAVAQALGRQQSQGRYYASPGAPRAWDSAGHLRSGFTRTCRFNSGPLAGTTMNFSHTLGAQPAPIGSACADGSSTGVAVASRL